MSAMTNLLEQVYELQKENKELMARNRVLTHELVWINCEVWPLVHGLTSRQCVRERFRRLPDVINQKVIHE